MSRQERRAPHPARLGVSLALTMLCLAVSNRTHPDDISAAVRFRSPHVVAGGATEFAITAVGLVQGVTYRLIVSLARGGDMVSADETSVAWSHEMAAARMDAHVFTHTLPPLSLGPHTLRVTLLDAAAGDGEDAELASMVQRLTRRRPEPLQRSATWLGRRGSRRRGCTTSLAPGCTTSLAPGKICLTITTRPWPTYAGMTATDFQRGPTRRSRHRWAYQPLCCATSRNAVLLPSECYTLPVSTASTLRTLVLLVT